MSHASRKSTSPNPRLCSAGRPIQAHPSRWPILSSVQRPCWQAPNACWALGCSRLLIALERPLPWPAQRHAALVVQRSCVLYCSRLAVRPVGCMCSPYSSSLFFGGGFPLAHGAQDSYGSHYSMFQPGSAGFSCDSAAAMDAAVGFAQQRQAGRGGASLGGATSSLAHKGADHGE